jgi:putative endonuclease
MIYQRLAKVFLIRSGASTAVVGESRGFLAAIRGHASDNERKHVLLLHSRRPQTRNTLHRCPTNNLRTRLGEHRAVEEYASPQDAITHAKQLKSWHRDWKIQLIEKDNLD